jgi:hypothetical protein
MSPRQGTFQGTAEEHAAASESVQRQIERALPYDAPHSADAVRDAAHGVYALVRYLNNATGPGNGGTTLRLAPTVDDVLGGIHSAAYALDQLLSQLANALARQSSDPTLYDDRRDRSVAAVAADAADRILAGRDAAMAFADSLTAVRSRTVHLGHDLIGGGDIR